MATKSSPAWLTNPLMKKTLTQLALVAVPKVLGGAFSVAVSGVLLHYLGPAEFGVYAIALTIVALTEGALGASIDMGVVKRASLAGGVSATDARRFEQSGVFFKLALGAMVLGLLALAGEPLAQHLFGHTPETVPAFAAGGPASVLPPSLAAATLPLLLLTGGVATGVLLLRSLLLHLQLAQRFGAYCVLESWVQLLRVAAAVIAITVLTPSAFTLLGMMLFGTLAALALGAVLARPLWTALRPSRVAARELMGTIRWFLVTFAFSASLSRIDVLLLGKFGSLEQVGIYAAGQIFAQIPELVGTYLAVVFSAKVAPAAAAGQFPALLRKVQTACWTAAVLLGAAALVLVPMGTPWIPAVYADAAAILLILLPGTLAAMCAFPVAIPYVMFMRPRFIFLLDLVTLPIVLLAYYLAIREAGAVGAAWVTGLTRLIKLSVIQYVAWRWARCGMQASPAAML